MAGQSVVISVLADTKNFAAGMADSGKHASGLTGMLKGVGVAAGVAFAAASVAAGAFLVDSFKAVAEVERLNAQTSAVLASTGGAAGRTSEQITGLADSLEKLTGVQAEGIQEGQNLLLTFTNIKGTNFDAATKSALDMSVAMGTDMSSAATLVGKALNDPIKGIGALSKVGVQLTDDQKALIASLVETGDVAGAQAVILKELNTQFGGSAEAFGGTFLGTVEKVKNSAGNLGESLVSALLPAATSVLGKINDLLVGLADNPGFIGFVTDVGEFIAGLVSGEGAVGGFASQFGGLFAAISPLGNLIKVIGPLLPQLLSGFGEIAGALGTALAPVLPVLTEALGQVAGALSGVLGEVLPVLVPLIVTLAEAFGGILGAALPPLIKIIGTLVAVLGPIIAAILPPLVTLITSLAEILTVALVPIIEILGKVFGDIVIAVAPLLVAVGELVGALLSALLPIFEAILPPILAVVKVFSETLGPVLTVVIGIIAAVVTGIVEFITWIVKLFTGAADAGNGLEKMGQSVLDFFGSILGTIGNFFAGAGTLLWNAGSAIIQGLINGISGAAQGLWSFVADIGMNIANAFKSILGIHSPSKVFAGFGVNVIAGLEQGLAVPNRISSIMGDVSGQVSGGFSAELETPTGYRAGQYRAASAVSDNIVSLSPIALQALEGISNRPVYLMADGKVLGQLVQSTNIAETRSI